MIKINFSHDELLALLEMVKDYHWMDDLQKDKVKLIRKLKYNLKKEYLKLK